MVFKRKQFVVLSLVIMIVIAGYLQYSYRKSSISVSDKENGKLGEAVYVDNKDLSSENDENNDDKNILNDIGASKHANDFFAQAKLDREVTRSKDTDTLKQITEDVNASKDIKTKAYEQMIALVENSDKEMRVEMLVKEKGFSEVIAIFGDDGSLDIFVKAPSLTSTKVAQISDVVSRQAKIDIEKIHIKNVY